MNLLEYTKKLSDQIKYYDTLAKNTFTFNPFAKPINIIIVWVEENYEE